MVAACPLETAAREAALQAAQMFEQDVDPVQVARLLVKRQVGDQWRRCWRAAQAALASSRRGPCPAR